MIGGVDTDGNPYGTTGLFDHHSIGGHDPFSSSSSIGGIGSSFGSGIGSSYNPNRGW